MPTVAQLEEMLAREPDDVFLHYSLAMLLKKVTGREHEALARFDRCVELDADYVPAYFQKAQLLAALGDVEAARGTLAAGIERARKVGDEHARGEMEEFLATL